MTKNFCFRYAILEPDESRNRDQQSFRPTGVKSDFEERSSTSIETEKMATSLYFRNVRLREKLKRLIKLYIKERYMVDDLSEKDERQLYYKLQRVRKHPKFTSANEKLNADLATRYWNFRRLQSNKNGKNIPMRRKRKRPKSSPKRMPLVGHPPAPGSSHEFILDKSGTVIGRRHPTAFGEVMMIKRRRKTSSASKQKS